MISFRYMGRDSESIPQLNALFVSGRWKASLSGYLNYCLASPELAHCFRFNIEKARQQYRTSRSERPLAAGVFCWNIANNALGRAETLRAIYQRAGYDAELMGMLPYPAWNKVWSPLAAMLDRICYFELAEHSQLLFASFQFVLQHPLDIVHISKPRLPGVIVGLLYKFIWSAKVIMDVDDEELAFVGQRDALSIEDISDMPPILDLKLPFWTQLSVGATSWFDAITVSNSALQKRYGGEIIPHVRDKALFDPRIYNKTLERQRLGIPLDKKVVLFLGTPRAHKGIIETAQALADLNRDDYLFVVIGNFIEQELKSRLLAIESLNLLLLPDQPYDNIARTVVVADLCVLLQDATNLASQFQLPAKLIDALAMGVTVLLETTDATSDFADNKLVIPVTKSQLVKQLTELFNGNLLAPDKLHCRDYFETYLSEQAMSLRLRSLVDNLSPSNKELEFVPELMSAIASNNVVSFLKAIHN